MEARSRNAGWLALWFAILGVDAGIIAHLVSKWPAESLAVLPAAAVAILGIRETYLMWVLGR